MSAFPKMLLTNVGIALQAKVQSGVTLELTRIGLGDGNLNGQPISSLKNLINQTASVPINDKEIIKSNTLQVPGFFSNQDIQKGFYWREFGVFANDPDSGEILYAYSNAGNAGDYIPTIADQRIEKYIYASFAVENAENVNITIPQSDTFIPKKEKGAENGVASLDETGKIPQDQLPELDFIPNDEKGHPNGVAPLNKDKVLEIEYGGTGANNVQEAIYNLGCMPRENLLDNWYFVGGGIDGKLPINQRGLSKYLSMYNNKYGIDRWFGLTMWGSVEASQTLELDGLVVASTPLQSYPDAWGGIWQKIDDLQDYIGQTATLSIYATDIETADASQVQSPNLVACNESTGFLHYTPIKNNTVTSMSFEITEKIEMVGVQVYSGTTHSNSLKIKAIKLEIGDNQTLARQLQDGSWLFLEKPDYTTELLKSQRYYQLYSDQELRPIKAIDCRPQMRIDPTQTTIMIGDVNYYVNDAQL